MPKKNKGAGAGGMTTTVDPVTGEIRTSFSMASIQKMMSLSSKEREAILRESYD
jgi:hypothetical protein